MSDRTNIDPLRERLKHIARFRFGPFKNTTPAKIILMPADNDHKSNGVGMEWSYDSFIDDVLELFQSELEGQRNLLHVAESDLAWCLGKLRGLGHPNERMEQKYGMSKDTQEKSK